MYIYPLLSIYQLDISGSPIQTRILYYTILYYYTTMSRPLEGKFGIVTGGSRGELHLLYTSTDYGV